MEDVKRSRFKDAAWAGKPEPIIIGGVGGIGSYVTYYLSRIGHELYLYDMDSVDETNLGGQLYRVSDIGKEKTVAVKEINKEFSDHDNIEICGKYDKDSEVSPIMISCFDNMAVRKLMFEKWKAQEDRELFLDGRFLAEYGTVFAVKKGDEEKCIK